MIGPGAPQSYPETSFVHSEISNSIDFPSLDHNGLRIENIAEVGLGISDMTAPMHWMYVIELLFKSYLLNIHFSLVMFSFSFSCSNALFPTLQGGVV